MLEGKIALVTGGASGIGAAIVSELAYGGATVIIHCHASMAQADALRDRLNEAGLNSFSIGADFRDTTQISELIKQIQRRVGRIDILVNNAGIAFTENLAADVDIAEWKEVFTVNVDAPFLLIKYTLPGMRERRWGRIINIGSNSVRVQSPGAAAYVASKAALHAMTAVIAKEEGRNNILVNTVAPGVVSVSAPMAPVTKDSAAQSLSIVDTIPLRRFCRPNDVAQLVSFLCSEKADYITGQVYFVNGGDRIETFHLGRVDIPPSNKQ